jgi:tetratricopeptide (TPR) repeat protein
MTREYNRIAGLDFFFFDGRQKKTVIMLGLLTRQGGALFRSSLRRYASTDVETDKGKRVIRAAQLYQSAESGIGRETWDVAVSELENVEELCSDLWQPDGRIGSALDRAQVLTLLAFARQCMGNLGGASEAYSEGLQLFRSRGKEDVDSWHRMGESMVNYAEVLAYRGDAEEAVGVASEAFDIVREAHGDESELAAAVRANLGAYLCTLERYEEARPHLFGALATFERELGRDNGYTAGTLRNAYKMLESLGLEDECAKLRQEWADQAKELEFEPDPTKFVDMSPSERVMEDALADWTEPRKAFDPDGFIKKTGASREKIDQFIETLERERFMVPPELLELIKRDVALMGTGRSGLDHADILCDLIDNGKDISALADVVGDDGDPNSLSGLPGVDDLSKLFAKGALPPDLAEQVRQVQDDTSDFESSLGVSVATDEFGNYVFSPLDASGDDGVDATKK